MATAAARFDYIVYDGTNGVTCAEFCANVCTQPVALISDVGGVLTLDVQDIYGNHLTQTYNTGDRLGVMPGQWYPYAYTQAQIDQNYVTVVP